MNSKFIVFFVCLLASMSVFSQKDTLVLTNGDRLHGDVKKMDRGILNFGTPYSSGDLKLKWKRVESVKSFKKFLVTASNGNRYKVERLSITSSKDTIVVDDGEGFFGIDNIVMIKPIKSGFVSRLNASISFGYNFTKASNLSQLSMAGSLGYTSDYYSIGTTFNSVRSSQDDVKEIQRTYGELTVNYFLKWDNYLVFQSEYLSNSEQKLKLRMTNKLGFGNYFIHNNRMFFSGDLGVAWNNEEYEDDVDKNRNSGEAFVALEVNFFDFNKFSLVSGVTGYPSLTEKGRFRTDFKLDLKYDLPLDLFVKLGFNYNYDNMPVDGTSYDDYVIRTTLGWEL